jgi:type II secretion system protein G
VLERLRVARKNECGFTLIELLIVIVILGILAGIVVIAVGAFTDRGETAACKADVKAVEVAVEAYRAKTSGYPANLGVLQPNYLREVPNQTDGAVGTTYFLTYTAGTGAVVGNLTGKTTNNCA